MSLSEDATAIHDRYRQNFAGKSRATRDLALLDSIITDISALRGSVAEAGDADLLSKVDDRIGLYQAERTAIAGVQAGGPDVGRAHRLGDWSWLGFQRYMRHFAGQNRLTRDTALLRELAAEQRDWRDKARGLAANHEAGWQADLLQQMERNLQTFEAELAEIPKARGSLTPERQASVLASRANEQFALYRVHFAGQKRSTRRLALLRRVIGELSDVHQEMLHLRDQHGLRSESHLGNIRKVSERIQHHKREFREIEQARAQQTRGDLARALADEANQGFGVYRENYAGKSRSNRDIDKLGELNDRLHQVARAMVELSAEISSDVHDKNLDIVLDNLKRYEREYRAIRDAQAPKV